MNSAVLQVRVNPQIKERALMNAKLAGTTLSAVVNGFLTKFANDRVVVMPNKETIEAMLEAEKLSCDPNAKRYTSIEELFKELDSDEA